MKTIGIVTKLAERAQEKAQSSFADVAQVIERYKRNGVEVYAVQYERGGLAGDTAVLNHYGTPTAEIWLTDTPQLLDVYGESKSDADSVNTFLQYFGVDKRYTFRPVRGGFMECV